MIVYFISLCNRRLLKRFLFILHLYRRRDFEEEKVTLKKPFKRDWRQPGEKWNLVSHLSLVIWSYLYFCTILDLNLYFCTIWGSSVLFLWKFGTPRLTHSPVYSLINSPRNKSNSTAHVWFVRITWLTQPLHTCRKVLTLPQKPLTHNPEPILDKEEFLW